ncbi:hypothetical protein HID58_081885 [Brassica napus]|uniref:Protein kinase domain-containing protein n=1 Tax=Brassica napus TaxID=3708 RepID=A0ABQ7YAF1_BRANA|nr:hypothetical protein HID58_081885 [Brassica napus]
MPLFLLRLLIATFPSSILPSQPKSTVGTPAYIAPGILLRQEYDGKSLGPSCGVTLYVMLVDAYPFENPDQPTDYRKIIHITIRAQPMQSLDNIMQIISEATIPDVRSFDGFLLNLRLMLIVAEK